MKFKADHKGHFYASSIAEWRVNEDPAKLIKDMKASGYTFNLIWVPLPLRAPYEIRWYVPVVEGCVLIAEYKKQ